jgi:hypothetical protein
MEEVRFACLFNVLLFGAVIEMCRVRQYRHYGNVQFCTPILGMWAIF